MVQNDNIVIVGINESHLSENSFVFDGFVLYLFLFDYSSSYNLQKIIFKLISAAVYQQSSTDEHYNIK